MKRSVMGVRMESMGALLLNVRAISAPPLCRHTQTSFSLGP